MRQYPPQVAGDVEWASVELGHEALAVVFVDDGLAVRDGRLVGCRGDAALVEAAVAYARGAAGLNAIAFACESLPFVAARRPVAGGWWRAQFWGQWDASNASGVSLELGGDDWAAVWLTQTADGVEVRVHRGEPWRVRGRDALPAALERIGEELGAALAARAAHRARAFAVGAVGERLLAALAQPGATLHVRDRWPEDASARIERHEVFGDEIVEILREEGGVVHVGDRALHGFDELDAALPAIVAELAAKAARPLSAERLRPGAHYRVLKPFGGLAVGARVTFLSSQYQPFDDVRSYQFDGGVTLWDVNDADREVLDDLHEYLALDLPA